MPPVPLRSCRLTRARPAPRLRLHVLAWAVGAVLSGSGVWAQTELGLPVEERPLFSVTPVLSVSETFTDNGGLVAKDRKSDAITELGAGVVLERHAGRVQGFLDYSLIGRFHHRGTNSDDVRHELDAAGRAELVEEFAFLDASAAISRQAVSAFGLQSSDDTIDNPNRTEFRRYRLSPHLRGRLGARAAYEARLSYAAADGSDSTAADVREMQALLAADSGPVDRLGWGLRASRDITDYRLGRRTKTDSATGTLKLAPHPQLLLSATGGREWTDALSLERESSPRWGWGLDWRPTQRTRLAAERERRYFGHSHSLLLSHQMPRSVWTYSDFQNVESNLGVSLGSRGTVFDLFFRQFASVEPDPGRRTVLVNSFLQANGLEPDAPVLGGFLTRAQTVTRRQGLSVAFNGLRTVAVLSLQQSRTRPLDLSIRSLDDLASSGAVRQRGGAVTVARRLTPTVSLHLGFAQQNTRGELDDRFNRLRTYSASWSERVGRRVTVSIEGRHTRFESPSSPYRENAIVARLRAEF